MKRTLLSLLFLALLISGTMAQAPVSAPVNAANAKKFVASQPQYAEHFAFQKDGSVYCADKEALAALLDFERSNGLSSTMAATVADRSAGKATPATSTNDPATDMAPVDSAPAAPQQAR